MSMTIQNRRMYTQLPAQKLIEHALANGEGVLNDTGALCINTGKFTGRSPKDKFIVKEPTVETLVDWSSDFNHPISFSFYEQLKMDLVAYLESRSELYSRICYAGSHPDYTIKIKVINEHAAGNLFSYNMFLKPGDDVSDVQEASEWTILQAPGFNSNPEIHGTRAGNFSVICFSEKVILIGGTGYNGEIKKGIFTVLNLVMPVDYGVLSMHCSANIGRNGDTALFFGLSGTGKTTLSTDPQRKLVGDDEHGWSNDAVFNFEGGCYAKIIGLDREHEPEIFSAIQNGALVENVVLKTGTNEIDFTDSSRTENTRVSYPISYIPNIARPSMGGPPKTIFFLTCDATGVLPPITKLDASQAAYFFLSGYTSKIAGTEAGINEPKPTFSACFGAPFLPLAPTVYADMLVSKLLSKSINVWLVNTGWCGKPYGEGKRIKLGYTRSLITSALNGSLELQPFDSFPLFNLQVPSYCDGVPAELLNPFETNRDNKDYIARLNNLEKMFRLNFKKFEGSDEFSAFTLKNIY